MGDVAEAYYYIAAYPWDIVTNTYEEDTQVQENVQVETETVIVSESNENGDENLGQNIDVTV